MTNSTKYCSKAPFRIGLAGGGTDVSPYSELYGGTVLNMTISLFAWTTITPRNDNKITISSQKLGLTESFESLDELPYTGELDLAKGVYNVLLKKYHFIHQGFDLVTTTDVPTRSGLGTSSTLVVSILGAFCEWQKFHLTPHEIAQMAFDIERIELGMAGGKQDQYTAAFGGLNLMNFSRKVKVSPLSISNDFIEELNKNLFLYFTNSDRRSAAIIQEQIQNVKSKKSQPVEAMHALKQNATEMYEAFIQQDGSKIGDLLNKAWYDKKKMAKGISNERIEMIYQTAIENGALGGKISGAGGGGFMLFYVDTNNHKQFISKLEALGGQFVPFQYHQKGIETWQEK